jgi:hypothetical protein
MGSATLLAGSTKRFKFLNNIVSAASWLAMCHTILQFREKELPFVH